MTVDLILRGVMEGTRVLAETCVADLWQGLVLMAVVAVCLRLSKSLGANARFALCGMLFLAGVGLSVGHLLRGNEASGGVRSSALLQVGSLWCPLLAAAWAVLLVSRATRLVRQGWFLRGLWRRATPIVASDAIVDLLRGCGRGGRARLCTSAEVVSPCVIGFRSPRLLLPEALRGCLSEQELRQIVLHECEHLRRHDDWTNLLQKIGLMLFPLHPVLLWMDRRMSLERELACDAGVVLATGKPLAYAGCLARLAEHRLCARTLALSLAAWGHGSELTQRVSTLLRPRQAPHRGIARVALGVLSVALLGGTVEMEKIPSLIAFGSSSAPRQVAEVQSVARASAPQAHMVSAMYHLPASSLATGMREAAAPVIGARRPARRERPDAHQARLAAEQISGSSQGRTQIPTRPANRAATEISTRYAAIPFGDGWLVFQL